MITGVNHLTLAVRDIEEFFTFYHDVLGFTPIQKSPISAYLLAGEMWIALTLDAQARQEPLPEYTHIAFTVAPADFDR
jgi:catechol 2,3-dioxygenase-like lactoylglutathione lyase family enzyme